MCPSFPCPKTDICNKRKHTIKACSKLHANLTLHATTILRRNQSSNVFIKTARST